MTDRSIPRISKLPFYVADFVLIALAGWIMLKTPHSLAGVPLALMVGCVMVAFMFAVAPYVLEYQAMVKFSEAGQLTDTVAQIAPGGGGGGTNPPRHGSLAGRAGAVGEDGGGGEGNCWTHDRGGEGVR